MQVDGPRRLDPPTRPSSGPVWGGSSLGDSRKRRQRSGGPRRLDPPYQNQLLLAPLPLIQPYPVRKRHRPGDCHVAPSSRSRDGLFARVLLGRDHARASAGRGQDRFASAHPRRSARPLHRPREHGRPDRGPGGRGEPAQRRSTSPRPAAGCGRRPTAAPPSRRSSTASRRSASARSRSARGSRRWFTSARAKVTRATACQWGSGVFKSTDGGKTWTHCGLADTHHIGRVVVHPKNPDIAYVAAIGHFWGPNPERGLYKTTDGGKTWKNVEVHRREHRLHRRADGPGGARHALRRRVAGPPRRLLRRQPEDTGGRGGRASSRPPTAARPGRRWRGGLPEKVGYGRCGIGVYRKDPKVVFAVVAHERDGGAALEHRPAGERRSARMGSRRRSERSSGRHLPLGR